jgi:hypothetical protein
MRYMIMLKADAANQEPRMPSDEELTEMGRYNEQLMTAGVLLGGEGLHPVSTGTWITFDGDDRSVTDGPFTESKELVAGFWIVQVASKEEAVEWARRVPIRSGAVEVRRVHDTEDFDQENEYVQKEHKWRDELEGRTA